MHQPGDEFGEGRHRDQGGREGDEFVATTLALGEEGDPYPEPDPVLAGEEPIFTTLAVGEEGEPEPLPEAIGFPEEPVFTTFALGEEGGGVDVGWQVFASFITGEEGDPAPDDPWAG